MSEMGRAGERGNVVGCTSAMEGSIVVTIELVAEESTSHHITFEEQFTFYSGIDRLIVSYEIYAQARESLLHHMHAMTLAASRYPEVIIPSSFVQCTRFALRVPYYSQVRGRKQGSGLYSEAKRARVALSELRRDTRYEPLSFESLLRMLRRPVED
jgi:hypothetical protein